MANGHTIHGGATDVCGGRLPQTSPLDPPLLGGHFERAEFSEGPYFIMAIKASLPSK